MQNRTTNIFNDSRITGSPSASRWEVDSQPAARLAWLFFLMALPLVIILGRLVQLQCFLTDDYVAGLEQHINTTDEPIPASTAEFWPPTELSWHRTFNGSMFTCIIARSKNQPTKTGSASRRSRGLDAPTAATA